MKWLVHVPEPPFTGHRAREQLDLVLMALAHDEEVRVAFVGRGVLNLVNRSQSKPIRDFTRALKSLDLYGVKNVYASSEALDHYKLSADKLSIHVDVVSEAQLAKIRDQQDVLM